MEDPFGTAALRRAVLDAWAAAPHRFREDANAEEYLSIGYAGRVIAELAANGADAAEAAGVEGRILIGLDGRTLCVANAGAPLTAAGVAALASLRASAKRTDPGAEPASVGHFGVGFTAARAISDEIVVVSVSGGVRFSVADTAAALASLGGDDLRAEVLRREGQLPALRLPWPVSGLVPPDGYATEVRLLLRDDVDIGSLAMALGLDTDSVRTGGPADGAPHVRTADLPGTDMPDGAGRAWPAHVPAAPEAAFDLAADLLWALPALTEVALPAVTVQRRELPEQPGVVELVANDATGETAQHFRVHRTAGDLPPALLADRPVEERGRTAWFVTWIVSLGSGSGPRSAADPLGFRGGPGESFTFVGAPTPTAERIGMPARLVASLPVDEVRSRIAPGPLTGFMVERAVVAYGELIRALPAEQRLALIPPPGFPLGEFDALLRERLSAGLSRAELLVDAAGQAVAPAEAVIVAGIDGRAATAVAEALPGLIAYPARTAQVEALRGLGVRVGDLGEALNAVAMVERPVAFYLPLYDALAETQADDLAGLPLPRSGGGTLIGARGVLLPAGADPEVAAQAARLVPGLRVAAPGLDHPLLRRLGARELDAETLLAAPELARELRRRYDDFDSGTAPDDWDDGSPAPDFAAFVLGLVADVASVPPGSETDLSRLLLTDESGQRYPAGELLMRGAQLSAVLADDADLPTVGPDWVERYGTDVLDMLGVRTTFGVVRYGLPPGDDADLDAVDLWWEDAAAGTGVPADAAAAAGPDDAAAQEFTAITDLDLVADDAWPQALAMIAASPPAREALRRTAFGQSYSAWWLSRYAVIGGRPPGHWRTADATGLAGLYDPVPLPGDANLGIELLTDIGVLRTLPDAAADPAELLARWADGSRPLSATRVAAVTAAVIDALAAADDEIPLPATVRTLTGAVIDAESAAVLDHPMLAQVCDPAALVAGGRDPARVADLLDLPLASEEWGWTIVDKAGEATTAGALPGAAHVLGWLGRAGLAEQPVTVIPGLSVRTRRQEPARVAWWVTDDLVAVDGSAGGIARALAYLAGRWPDRHLLQTLAAASDQDLAELGVDVRP